MTRRRSRRLAGTTRTRSRSSTAPMGRCPERSVPTEARTRRRHPEGCLRASGSGGGSRTPLCGTSWREPVPRPHRTPRFSAEFQSCATKIIRRPGSTTFRRECPVECPVLRRRLTFASSIPAACRRRCRRLAGPPAGRSRRTGRGPRARWPARPATGRRAEVGQQAAVAPGRSGRADGPTVEDQPEAERAAIGPPAPWR